MIVLNEDLITGFLILFVLVIGSTAFLFFNQYTAVTRGPGAQEGARRGASAPSPGTGFGFLRSANSMGAHSPQPLHAKHVQTKDLTPAQVAYHQILPLKHGVRTITLSYDALFPSQEQSSESGAATKEAGVFRDLMAIAQVFIFVQLKPVSDKAELELSKQKVLYRIFQYVPQYHEKDCPNGFPAHHVIFCTSNVGKIAFARQIEPQVHIEDNLEVLTSLIPHIPLCIFVTKAITTPLKENVHITENLPTYFENLKALQ